MVYNISIYNKSECARFFAMLRGELKYDATRRSRSRSIDSLILYLSQATHYEYHN